MIRLGNLSGLAGSLGAARLLREEIRDAPVLPSGREFLARWFLERNAESPASRPATEQALLRSAQGDGPDVTRPDLEALAAACGGAGPRRGIGEPFQGRAAPLPEEVGGLTVELVDSVNSAVAVESWPPVVRAFVLGFLLRLVQPFDAPATAVAQAGEALLLGADGFRADRMLLPRPGVGAEPAPGLPDPGAWVHARVHALVDGLGASREQVRGETARAVVRCWLASRQTRLNARQRRVLEYLAAEPDRRLSFRDYVRLHAGRRAPSLRSLQRDWQGLRDRGLVEAAGEEWWLRLSTFSFDPL